MYIFIRRPETGNGCVYRKNKSVLTRRHAFRSRSSTMSGKSFMTDVQERSDFSFARRALITPRFSRNTTEKKIAIAKWTGGQSPNKVRESGCLIVRQKIFK